MPGRRYNSQHMILSSGKSLRILFAAAVLLAAPLTVAQSTAPWHVVLTDGAGKPIAAATISLHSIANDYKTSTTADGEFLFAAIASGSYEVSVTTTDKDGGTHSAKISAPVVVSP